MVQVGVHMEGRAGHVHQAQGTYNPISNQWVDAPEGTVAHTAGDRSRQEEQDWYNAKTGQHAHHCTTCICPCLCRIELHVEALMTVKYKGTGTGMSTLLQASCFASFKCAACIPLGSIHRDD